MTGHARLLVAAGLGALSAVGCWQGGETTVRISHVHATSLEVPPSVRRLAVVTFWPDAGAATGRKYGLADDLVVLLADPPGRYDLVSLPGPAGGPLGPGAARRLAKGAGADAVLYGSATVAVSKTSSPRPETGDPVRSSVVETSSEVVACRVSVRFAMDDVATGRTIAAVVLTKADRVTDGSPGTADRTVRRLLRRCSVEFVRLIGPRSVDFLVVLDTSDATIISRGNALAREKRYAEALECYTAALAEAPGDVAAAFNAGVMYEQQRRCIEALAMYDRAFALVPLEKYDRARSRVSDRANNND